MKGQELEVRIGRLVLRVSLEMQTMKAWEYPASRGKTLLHEETGHEK